MNDVQVEPDQRRVRVGGGCTWRDVDAATTPYDLATPGCRISSVGVGGSTLGGGYGWLMRRHGLAIDNLLAAELVLADGRAIRVDEFHHEDIFWALRGGGGNFGVVTALEFRLHALPDAVTAGMLFYPIHQAADVLAAYSERMATATDDLSAQCNFLIAPDASFVTESLRGQRVVAIPVCHLGSRDQAERDLAPLRALNPLLDRIRPMAYAKLQRLYDAAGVFGRQVFGRSGHLPALSSDVMNAFLDHAVDITSRFSIAMISPLGGAVARVDEHATAFGYRATAFDCAIDAVWTDAADSRRHVAWVDRFWSAVRPMTTGVYVNELGNEGPERIRAAYHPETYARLRTIKQRLDPDNVFRSNQNIEPHMEASRC
jgi:FAD/FMN-containing dehydrogenase